MKKIRKLSIKKDESLLKRDHNEEFNLLLGKKVPFSFILNLINYVLVEFDMIL